MSRYVSSTSKQLQLYDVKTIRCHVWWLNIFIHKFLKTVQAIKMGTTGQSITLANSIIGVGILAMPFCFQQVSISPCFCLLAITVLR